MANANAKACKRSEVCPDLASFIDHTFLKAAGAPDAIEKLCAEAAQYHFACAMVNPTEVLLAVKLLKNTGVRVGTVINFPLGADDPIVAGTAAHEAVVQGARDIDFVINIRKLKAALHDRVVRKSLALDLDGWVRHVHFRKGAIAKLILECCYLTDEEKILGCRLAKKAGFDFVKTSTGFGTGGATVHDVKLLRKTVGKKMGVKAAGGIRTLADARAMLEAGANRLGCSAGVEIVRSKE